MFTGIVEEKGKVRYIQLTGESGILADDQKKQSWQLQGRKPGKPGTCNGCRRQVRRTHSKRPY